jgi:hypothetical protein
LKIPTVEGVIDRRILVNYQVDPGVLARLLPSPFEPKLVNGAGIAGVCLIRLKEIRPRFLPSWLGIKSENAAHRIAVQWQDGDDVREGVYIPRRDTSSRLNRMAGGRFFPGVHHQATFKVSEDENRFYVQLDSSDGATHLLVEARLASELPAASVFNSLAAASYYFEGGSLGYSATGKPGVYDGLELQTMDWEIKPLAVEQVRSTFFEDKSLFPDGSTQFDCALLMQGIRHRWHGRDPLYGHEIK